jgi:hypothetical protein
MTDSDDDQSMLRGAPDRALREQDVCLRAFREVKT